MTQLSKFQYYAGMAVMLIGSLWLLAAGFYLLFEGQYLEACACIATFLYWNSSK